MYVNLNGFRGKHICVDGNIKIHVHRDFTGRYHSAQGPFDSILCIGEILTGRTGVASFVMYSSDDPQRIVKKSPYGTAPTFSILNEANEFTPSPEKTTNASPKTFSAMQAASQSSLTMNNYTSLVISRNDKYKQLTLFSRRKLTLTDTFCVIK
jgi:hypothetical protein